VCDSPVRESTRVKLQVQPGHPGFPRAMGYGLYVLSPVSGVSCHRCRPRTGGADRRHGRGARTTRLRRPLRTFRPASKPPDAAASIATRTTFRDDREASLRWRGLGEVRPRISISVKQNISHRGGLTLIPLTRTDLPVVSNMQRSVGACGLIGRHILSTPSPLTSKGWVSLRSPHPAYCRPKAQRRGHQLAAC